MKQLLIKKGKVIVEEVPAPIVRKEGWKYFYYVFFAKIIQGSPMKYGSIFHL